MQKTKNRCSILCPKCVHELETTSQHKIWYTAIGHQMKDEQYVEKDIESHDMEYLEQNGYIRSTEISQGFIVITPNECLHVITEYGLHANLYCTEPETHHGHLYE